MLISNEYNPATMQADPHRLNSLIQTILRKIFPPEPTVRLMITNVEDACCSGYMVKFFGKFTIFLPLIHKGIDFTFNELSDFLADEFVRLTKVFLKSQHGITLIEVFLCPFFMDKGSREFSLKNYTY